MSDTDLAAPPVAETVERFAPLVRRIARGLLRDPHDAEDAAQESLCRIVANVSRFGGRGSLEGWVRRIAVRTSLSALRWRRLSALLLVDVPAAPTPARDADAVARLYAALDRLSSRERAVFVLRYQEDLPFSDVAAAIGCREVTARGYAFRALTKLRRWLGATP